jgi:leader peptidase (prepilin peptidase)/N-methyltransferase
VGEGICCGAFVVLAARFGMHAVLVPYLVLAAGLLALSIVDFRLFLLPNRIVGPLTGLVVGGFVIVAAVEGSGANVTRGVEAGVAATAALGVLHLAYPQGLGLGDVKLAFVLGVGTGWVSWGALGLSLFIAAALGAVFGVAGAVIAGEPVHGRRVPFGPFLAAGTLVAAVFGPTALNWYAGRLLTRSPLLPTEAVELGRGELDAWSPQSRRHRGAQRRGRRS